MILVGTCAGSQSLCRHCQVAHLGQCQVFGILLWRSSCQQLSCLIASQCSIIPLHDFGAPAFMMAIHHYAKVALKAASGSLSLLGRPMATEQGQRERVLPKSVLCVSDSISD